MNIDPEFKNLIPPLAPEEKEQLTESVITEGCRDALVVWAGENILLDGHNRFEICYEYRIPYQTVEIELADRQAAINWIINNQLGRRNLTPTQASYLRGKRYQAEKMDGFKGNQHTASGQNVQNHTATRLADEYKVDEKTIRRDAQFAQAVDLLAGLAGEDTRQAILTRDAPVTKKDVIELAKQAETEPEQAKERAAGLRNPALYTSDTPEWYTPSHIIYRVLQVLKTIDLDPCSNGGPEPNVPALAHFTRDDNGLSKDWKGRVYMNPPYGRELADWINHLVRQYEFGGVTEAITLVPSRTDTEWFRCLRSYPRCFIWGRLKFSQSENAAPFPSMAVYLGSNPDRFIDAFKDIGDVYGLLHV